MYKRFVTNNSSYLEILSSRFDAIEIVSKTFKTNKHKGIDEIKINIVVNSLTHKIILKNVEGLSPDTIITLNSFNTFINHIIHLYDKQYHIIFDCQTGHISVIHMKDNILTFKDKLLHDILSIKHYIPFLVGTIYDKFQFDCIYES